MNLDDDLKEAFNEIAGKDIAVQQLILQIQMDRRLANIERVTAKSTE